MLLRGSGEHSGKHYDIRATTTDGVASGVDQGELLVDYSNAVMAPDEALLDKLRGEVRAAVGDAGFTEAAATAANFNQMDRIADSTGIPSDVAIRATMAELGQELGTVNFASAKSTLQRL